MWMELDLYMCGHLCKARNDKNTVKVQNNKIASYVDSIWKQHLKCHNEHKHIS